MPAVDYRTLDDVLENFTFQCEVSGLLADFITYVNIYRVANPDLDLHFMTVDEKNTMLRLLTGCTVATGTDLNCYPRGYDDTLCFDLNGDPVP